MKIIKKELWPVLLLLLVALFFWRHIPSLQFQHEGAYYFKFTSLELNFRFLDYDTFAKVLFHYLTPLFQSQVSLYMWFLLVVMLLIDAIFYFVVRVVTGSRLAGFLAGILFALSYIGKYDMFGNGAYQYFVQRGVLLLFLLPALLFFILYFQRSFQLIYYILGLGTYLLGITMGFFGTWLLPIFVFYPLVFLLFNLSKGKDVFLKTAWTPLPFIIGNLNIISRSTYVPREGEILEWLFGRVEFVIQGISQQLTVMTLPAGTYGSLINSLSKFIAAPVNNIPEEKIAFWIIAAIIFSIYFASSLILWRLNRKWFSLAAASLLSLLTMLFFNLLLNANSVMVSGSSRYFYFPNVVFAIYWGLFFAVLFLDKRKLIKLSVIVFFVFWAFQNNLMIRRDVKRFEWMHKANKKALDFVKELSPELKSSPHYVWLPTTLGPYGAHFAKRFYSHPEGKFFEERIAPLDIPALAREGVPPEKLYVLHFDPGPKVVVDKTEESRSLLREIYK